jgi:hypothetical protein
LLVQAINVRWNSFYQLLVGSSKEFREELLGEIKKYNGLQPDKHVSQLESDKTDQGFSPEIKRILKDFRLEDELWKFLTGHINTLSQIKDWEIYRRAAESVKEIPAMRQEMSTSYRIERNFNRALKIWSEIEPILSCVKDTLRTLFFLRNMSLYLVEFKNFIIDCAKCMMKEL